ncbi:MAG: hypothetical protein P8Z71_08700 [Candidatus Sulfobium sp.]
MMKGADYFGGEGDPRDPPALGRRAKEVRQITATGKENTMKASQEREGMSGRKVLSLGLMLLAVFALIAVASVEFYPPPAQAAGFRGMKTSPDQVVSRLKDRLNLTDEQVKAIEPIISDSMAKSRELMNELRQLRQSTDAKIVGILTKEQAVEFQKIQDQRRERMWRRPAGPR